jgi:hypothetical protein
LEDIGGAVAASTEVVIGDLGAQHLVIRPLSRSQPRLFDHSDGSSIVCEVEITAGGFRGGYRADLRSEEFHAFLSQTAELTRSLEGAAALTSMEGQLALQLTGDSTGLTHVAGEAVDSTGSGNRLQFGFDVDQACLPEIVRSLEALLAAYPVLSAPDVHEPL